MTPEIYITPAIVSCNFDQLKSELAAKLDNYRNIVYGDNEIKAAKADRALLNKVKKAINDERIRQEKEHMKVFEPVKVQSKELLGMVDEVVEEIDKQIKAAEEQWREARLGDIQTLVLDVYMPAEWNGEIKQTWLNKSTSLATVRKELEGIKDKLINDLLAINALPETMRPVARRVYDQTGDLAKALNEAAVVESYREPEPVTTVEEAPVKKETVLTAPEKSEMLSSFTIKLRCTDKEMAEIEMMLFSMGIEYDAERNQ